jgi:hypothetical protein
MEHELSGDGDAGFFQDMGAMGADRLHAVHHFLADVGP